MAQCPRCKGEFPPDRIKSHVSQECTGPVDTSKPSKWNRPRRK